MDKTPEEVSTAISNTIFETRVQKKRLLLCGGRYYKQAHKKFHKRRQQAQRIMFLLFFLIKKTTAPTLRSTLCTGMLCSQVNNMILYLLVNWEFFENFSQDKWVIWKLYIWPFQLYKYINHILIYPCIS